QLSRESEILVICVYLFWLGFLRGQRTILDMPPALPTMSRSQYAPVSQTYNVEPSSASRSEAKPAAKSLVIQNPTRKIRERFSRDRVQWSNASADVCWIKRFGCIVL